MVKEKIRRPSERHFIGKPKEFGLIILNTNTNEKVTEKKT
jgi:hypothetical protein